MNKLLNCQRGGDPESTYTRALHRFTKVRIENAVHTAVATGSFSRVAVDSVMRLQKLCDNTVSSVECINLVVDDDVADWAIWLHHAEKGLHAAKILRRVLTAGREDKHEHVVDSVVPVVEVRMSTDAFKIFASQKKPLAALLHMCGPVFHRLEMLVSEVNVAESAATKMEFLAMRLLFVENAHARQCPEKRLLRDSLPRAGRARVDQVRRPAVP
ncbi:hypothetical protein EJ06DRAFT_534831 [Trichodelitschia bisporula]|uniref:Uncharacterized protein n=1 Tax=Trichodelitschia bisporula TaxID=703511 RepID=A0A6G1HIL9_9PEZI|nr:hypothetical protein EJ06DRAFT_534831 [Trichodelitschia bisporula]